MPATQQVKSDNIFFMSFRGSVSPGGPNEMTGKGQEFASVSGTLDCDCFNVIKNHHPCLLVVYALNFMLCIIIHCFC